MGCKMGCQQINIYQSSIINFKKSKLKHILKHKHICYQLGNKLKFSYAALKTKKFCYVHSICTPFCITPYV